MFNLLVTGTVRKIRKSWCVYEIRDVTGQEILDVGFIELVNLFTLNGSQRAIDVDREVMVRLISVHDHKAQAMNQFAKSQSEAGLSIIPVQRFTQVKCVDTGETFQSAVDCAKMHGLSPSALSNHLNNKPGFKSVKGKKYIKIV